MAEHHNHADDSAPPKSSLPVIGSALLVILWGVLVIGFLGVFLPVPPSL